MANRQKLTQKREKMLIFPYILLLYCVVRSTGEIIPSRSISAFSSYAIPLCDSVRHLKSFATKPFWTCSRQLKTFSRTYLHLRSSLSDKADSDFDIKEAPLSVGGVGTFLRSQQILELMIREREQFLENELMPPLRETLDKLLPQEAQLQELRQKYEDTQNAVFGSQIRPLEIRLIPLVDTRIAQEEAVETAKEEIEDLRFLLKRALEDYVPSGIVNVTYSGFNRTWQVAMKRSCVLGPTSESDLILTPLKEGGFEFSAAWRTKYPDQPLLIHTETETDESTRGIVISFATPEEGPRRLCAVAEWFGDTNSEDVASKKQQLQRHLQMDKLLVADERTFIVSTFSDPIPMRRRNELWLEIVPPEGEAWFNHAPKIATNIVAKNSTFYQLKDCPWSTPGPWTGNDPSPLPTVQSQRRIAWSISTSLLQGENKLICRTSASDGIVAVDKSSGGEVALSWADAPGMQSSDDTATCLFATGGVGGSRWPVRGQEVEAARVGLMEWVEEQGSLAPVDPLSFRLVLSPSAPPRLWTRISQAPPTPP